MEIQDAHSLVNFLRNQQGRFQAGILDLAKEALVVIQDQENTTNATPIEPINDLSVYLSRARQGSLVLDNNLLHLLESWQSASEPIYDR